jgi:hypothetical protein
VKQRMMVLVILTAAMVGLASPAHAKAPTTDVPYGQACADVVQGDSWYRDTNWTGTNAPASPTVFFQFSLGAPSCAPNGGTNQNSLTTYTVQIFPVYAGVADTTPAATNVYTGDGATQTFSSPPGNYVLPADPRGTAGAVCIVVTSVVGERVVDVAPDAGCGATDSWVLLDDTSSGGSRGWY